MSENIYDHKELDPLIKNTIEEIAKRTGVSFETARLVLREHFEIYLEDIANSLN
jgi:histone H3/H4